jgi:hypothetical protein
MEGLGSSIDVLKYGAIGVGLAILLYTGLILKQELALPNPAPRGETSF